MTATATAVRPTVNTQESLPNTERYNETLRELVAACNGFVYHGYELEAQIRAIKFLRQNPKQAAILLGRG